MIERIAEFEYELTCDICGESSGETFEEFMEAVDWKKQSDWKSLKDSKNNWHDVCPDCQQDDLSEVLK